MLAYAFVPARSGSKGLPHKNIRPIDGHPLLAYAVAFGLATGLRTFLSTDSEDYAAIGRAYGAEVPFLRGADASGDTAMEEMIIAEYADRFPDLGIPLPDVWVRLKPTNPFRRPESVRRGLEILAGDASVSAVRVTCAAEARLMVRNGEGFLEPLLKDHWDPARSVMRRTEFPDAYLPFNLDIFRHEGWARLGSAYMGDRIAPVFEHTITGLDINDIQDFDIARALIEARPRPPVVAEHIVDPRRDG